MPTEQDFAASFGVSRVTIRKALNMLQEEKLISRQQGRGTFAVPPPPKRQNRANFSGLLENIVDFEQHTKVRVLSFARVALPDEPARLLECDDRHRRAQDRARAQRQPVAVLVHDLPMCPSPRRAARRRTLGNRR